jgi:hypothetical protein
MSTPPNNPLKLPFFLLCAGVGALVALVGLLYAAWLLAVAGVMLLGAGLWLARIVRTGRNPRWLRAPLDRRRPRQPD